MARRARLTRPTPMRVPKIRRAKSLRQAPGREGEPPPPPTPPEIPMTPDQDEALLARWEAWRAQTNGSLPEYICWEWLTGKKRQIPGVDFIYQYAVFGGRTQFGGYVADFWFPQMRMVWRVMGLRWHRTNPNDRARDLVAKQLLSSGGMVVVDLYEDDLFTRPTFVLNKAWQGQRASTARAQ